MYLFFIYFYIGSYTMYELYLIGLNLFDPNTFNNLTIERLTVIPFINLGCILIGVLIVIKFMKNLLKLAGMDYKIEIWKWVSIFSLSLILLYLSLFEVQLIDIEGFRVLLMKPVLLNSIVSLICSLIVCLIIAPLYLKFGKILKQKKSGRKKAVSRFSTLIATSLFTFVICILLRIHFGNNWNSIIIIDFCMLFAICLSFIASLIYGFGEEMLCIVNLEELYITHKSGKLIHVEKFIDRKTTKESLISAFFMAINSMLQEIRTEGNIIERLVLDDKSEIILSFGHYIRGILIVNKYNHLFIDKLNLLIKEMEEKYDSKLKEWTTGSSDLSIRIKQLIGKLF